MAQKIKIPRPKGKEVRMLYKGLVTNSIGQRITTLMTVLQWYDQALDYVMSKGQFDPARIKTHERAIGVRKKAISSNSDHEKETFARGAIGLYEKLCVTLHPFPIDKAYAAYDRVKAKLENKAVTLENRYGKVVDVLTAALQPMGRNEQPLKITIEEQESPRKFDPVLNHLTYNKAQAIQLLSTMKQRGVLPLVVQEIKFLSRGCATEPDGNGKFLLNTEKQVAALLAMLTNFVEFSASGAAGAKLIKLGANAAIPVNVINIAPAVKSPHIGPSVKRSGPVKGPKVDNLYAQGSSAEMLYTTLKDSQWHKFNDLQKLTTANLKERLKWISQSAPAAGWWVELKKDEVRMMRKGV